jgi:hypothetical protein
MKRFACLLMIGLSMLAALMDAGNAQSSGGTKPLKSAPVPRLDPEALKIPDSAGTTEAGTFKVDKTHKVLPPTSPPSKVDLGKYDLEFKAGHTSDINPRTGFDSGEKSNLSNSSVGRPQNSALPDYFGLKLSAPTD